MAGSAVKCLILAVTVLTTVSTDNVRHNEKRTDDVSVSSLQTLVQQQAALIQTLQTRLTAAENRLNSVEGNVHTNTNGIADLRQKQSKAVGFTVRFSKDCTGSTCGIPLSSHSTLIFDHAVTNIGNAYNTKTGIFTAPVAGLYSFFLTEMSVNHHSSLSLVIVKEGSVLDLVYTEGPNDDDDQGSSQVTTHLSAGQQVWVRQNYGDAARGSWYTVFTGYLVHAD